MPLMRASALDYIQHHEDATPAFRLSVACRYEEADWYGREIRSILSGTSVTLSPNDIRVLPHAVTHRLLSVFRRLDMHRALIKAVPPPSVHPHATCVGPANAECRRAWSRFWLAEVGPKVVDTQLPWTGNTVLGYLSTLDFVTGMHSWACQHATINRVRDEQSDQLRADGRLIQEETGGLIKLCQDVAQKKVSNPFELDSCCSQSGTGVIPS